MGIVSTYMSKFKKTQSDPKAFVAAMEEMYQRIYSVKFSNAEEQIPAIYSVADQLETSFGLNASSLKNACIARTKGLYRESGLVYRQLKNTMECLSGEKF